MDVLSKSEEFAQEIEDNNRPSCKDCQTSFGKEKEKIIQGFTSIPKDIPVTLNMYHLQHKIDMDNTPQNHYDNMDEDFLNANIRKDEDLQNMWIPSN
ncbi:hypothetical protein M8J75_014289 [Diaphorina citri]|nr:hypothetical protein M8J75_014289 [Diaphorina citri]